MQIPFHTCYYIFQANPQIWNGISISECYKHFQISVDIFGPKYCTNLHTHQEYIKVLVPLETCKVSVLLNIYSFWQFDTSVIFNPFRPFLL